MQEKRGGKREKRTKTEGRRETDSKSASGRQTQEKETKRDSEIETQRQKLPNKSHKYRTSMKHSK